jgi:hypothetical protein
LGLPLVLSLSKDERELRTGGLSIKGRLRTADGILAGTEQRKWEGGIPVEDNTE